MAHEIKPVPWVAHKNGKPTSSPTPPRSRQTPHERLTWISVTALVIGWITFGIWHEDVYCQQNPNSGPNMRVDRSCYEVLAESSTWRAVMGNLGLWLILGSIVGFIVASWWWLRHNLRER
ncbi:hypothetical protein [Streptomyces sp. NPDC002690]